MILFELLQAEQIEQIVRPGVCGCCAKKIVKTGVGMDDLPSKISRTQKIAADVEEVLKVRS